MNKFCISLTLFLLSLSVFAEEMTTHKFGEWTVRCMPGQIKDCSATIGGSYADRPGYWVKMGLYIKQGETKETHLIVRSHPSISERKTIPLSVDRAQLGLLHPVCSEKYCEVDVTLNESDLEKIKTGRNIIVSFRIPPTTEGVALFLPLTGIAEALQFLNE